MLCRNGESPTLTKPRISSMERIHSVNSAAFNNELLGHISGQEIRDELKSYLGEYRFRLPQYKYNLLYLNNHLRDIYNNEPMLEKAARSIELKNEQRKNPSREIAEYQGIKNLDTVLQNALLGDRIIWASPPGSQIDGYGNYGFIFSGIIDDVNDGQKHLSMTAYRIEETSVEAYNRAISAIMKRQVYFDSPEEFLSQPFIINKNLSNPELILRQMVYPNKIDNKQFELAMAILDPLVKQFIAEAKADVTKDRLRQLFYTIENLAIQLKENINFTDLYSLSYSLHANMENFVQRYGSFKPLIVGGSCGGTGEETSIETILNRNILNKLTGHILAKILGEDEGFECPRCHFKTKEKVGNQCPGCKITKEQAQQQGLITC